MNYSILQLKQGVLLSIAVFNGVLRFYVLTFINIDFLMIFFFLLSILGFYIAVYFRSCCILKFSECTPGVEQRAAYNVGVDTKSALMERIFNFLNKYWFHVKIRRRFRPVATTSLLTLPSISPFFAQLSILSIFSKASENFIRVFVDSYFVGWRSLELRYFFFLCRQHHFCFQ